MKLTTAPIFGPGMVLQRHKELPVWGQAAPGAAVTLRLGPATARAVADGRGRWQATLPPQQAGGPLVMEICAGGETLRYPGVYLGEVWLAGGQSNMELPLSASLDGERAARDCADERLHYFAAPKITMPGPQRGAWHTVGPAAGGELSAVAYYAARTLADALGVHIGIVQCFWGGTYAHCWMPRDLLDQFAEGRRRLAWYAGRVGGKTDAEYEAENDAYQRQVDAWNQKVAARRARDPGVRQSTLDADYGPYPWPPPAGRTSFQCPGNLFDAMLRPLAPYALRGVWYYQGEQDEEWAQDYYALLRALIGCWRACWGQPALPVLLMQLPMFGSDFDWPALRAAQRRAADTLPGVDLVCLTDQGEEDNIHPTQKQIPGQRLARLALQSVYGLPVEGRAPVLVAAAVTGGAVQLRFASTGGALCLEEGGAGFELAGPDGRFAPARALVTAPNTVSLPFAGGAPTAVRYAWHSWGPAGLYGANGLPAFPFSCTLGH